MTGTYLCRPSAPCGHCHNCLSDNGDSDQLALADGFRPTDVGNADRLAAIANGRARSVHAWGKWIVYRQGVWHIDTGDALIAEAAKQVARGSIPHGRRARPRTNSTRCTSGPGSPRTSARRAAMIRLARAAPGVLVDHAELDRRPWLLNVHNGTIDLRTGELGPARPGPPADRPGASRLRPQVPQRRCGRLPRAVATRSRMRGYLQRAIGSGRDRPSRRAPVRELGHGANGKSRFYGAVHARARPRRRRTRQKSAVRPVPPRDHTPQSGLPVRRPNARSPPRPRPATGWPKPSEELTGGDRMTGAAHARGPMAFWPAWTAFMHTNHRPRDAGPTTAYGADSGSSHGRLTIP